MKHQHPGRLSARTSWVMTKMCAVMEHLQFCSSLSRATLCPAMPMNEGSLTQASTLFASFTFSPKSRLGRTTGTSQFQGDLFNTVTTSYNYDLTRNLFLTTSCISSEDLSSIHSIILNISMLRLEKGESEQRLSIESPFSTAGVRTCKIYLSK